MPTSDRDDIHDEQLELPVGDEPAGEAGELDPSLQEPLDPEPLPKEPAPPPAPSARELASQYGVDVSQFQDDAAAVRYLAEQARAAREKSELARYGEEYVRNAAEFQEFQRAKEAQAKAAQAEQKPLLWRHEWDPAWESLLTTDENGNIVPNTAKGGTPDLVDKYYRHQQHRLDVLNRLATDPEKHLDPYVQSRAEQVARKLIQEELAKFGQDLDARHFILANDHWLYEKDDRGARTLSDDGKYFAQTFKEIDEDPDLSGLGQKGKEKLALKALDQYRQQKAAATQQTPAEKKQDTLRRAAGYQPSAGASTNRTPDATGTAAPQNENASFREMLMSEFAANGYDPAAELAGV